MDAIFFDTGGPVDLEVTRRKVWELVARALADGGAHVVVLTDGEKGGAAARREMIPLCRTEEETRVADAVASYRDGYADGYVDCLTIMGKSP